jgi:hypothetical protein
MFGKLCKTGPTSSKISQYLTKHLMPNKQNFGGQNRKKCTYLRSVNKVKLSNKEL